MHTINKPSTGPNQSQHTPNHAPKTSPSLQPGPIVAQAVTIPSTGHNRSLQHGQNICWAQQEPAHSSEHLLGPLRDCNFLNSIMQQRMSDQMAYNATTQSAICKITALTYKIRELHQQLRTMQIQIATLIQTQNCKAPILISILAPGSPPATATYPQQANNLSNTVPYSNMHIIKKAKQYNITLTPTHYNQHADDDGETVWTSNTSSSRATYSNQTDAGKEHTTPSPQHNKISAKWTCKINNRQTQKKLNTEQALRSIQNNYQDKPCTKWGILDSGATGHFFKVDTPLKNKHQTHTPLCITIPNGKQLLSTHNGELDLPYLP